jgi:hypothetical protein
VRQELGLAPSVAGDPLCGLRYSLALSSLRRLLPGRASFFSPRRAALPISSARPPVERGLARLPACSQRGSRPIPSLLVNSSRPASPAAPACRPRRRPRPAPLLLPLFSSVLSAAACFGNFPGHRAFFSPCVSKSYREQRKEMLATFDPTHFDQLWLRSMWPFVWLRFDQ